METHRPMQNDEQFQAQLQECAELLVEKLQNDQYEQASELIHTLVEARDKHIFHSVGQLTRALHSAMMNFHVDADLDKNPAEVGGSEIRDASDRLDYVIKLSEKAATKTMDRVEAVAPMAMNMGEEALRIREQWVRLKRGEITKEGFKELYDQVEDFLNQMEVGTALLSTNLQDIILEQGYQDLGGQALKKVINLITNVESELVKLMRIAGQVEEVTGMATEKKTTSKKAGKKAGKKTSTRAAKSKPKAEPESDFVSGQDEVDDLLSSLGF